MKLVVEHVYFHNIGGKGDSKETKLNELCTQVSGPTGRIMLTVYYNEHEEYSWVTFKIEQQMINSIRRATDGVWVLSEQVGYQSLGAPWHPKHLTEATLEEMLYGNILTWLGRGELSGRGQTEAVWMILWNCLRTMPELRASVAEYYPQWIKGLDLK